MVFVEYALLVLVIVTGIVAGYCWGDILWRYFHR